jgi:twitching motility protein PilT
LRPQSVGAASRCARPKADTASVLDFNDLLRRLVDQRASDLHLKVGSAPVVRIDGRLERGTDSEVTAPELLELALTLIPTDRIEEWEAKGEIDFALGISGLGRFRVMVYSQRGTVSMAVRHVIPGIPSFDTLGLPPAVPRLAEETQGLVIVAGPAGAGKSTTIAAMIDVINEHQCRHVVTIEDPIEHLFRDKRSIISQRELGSDAPSYQSALARIMRQDPDVVYIGEIDDRDTAIGALGLATTGRLVLTSTPTVNVAQTITWLLHLFAVEEHPMVRASLASSLKAIVVQRLLERPEGRGRVPAAEILVNQSRVVENLLQIPGAPNLETVMAEGEYYGMQTFDQSLFQLCKDGVIGIREAVTSSAHPHELRASLQGLGMPMGGSEY